MEKNIANHRQLLVENPANFNKLPTAQQSNPDFIKTLLCRTFNEYIEYEKPSSKWAVRSLFGCLEFFKYTPPAIQNNTELIQKCIPRCSGYLYRYLSPAVKNNPDLFIFAAKYASSKHIWKLANRYLAKNNLSHHQLFDYGTFSQFIEVQSILAPDDSEKTLPFLAEKSVVLKAIPHQPQLFSRLNKTLQNNPAVARAAIKRSHLMFNCAGIAVKDNAAAVIDYVIAEAQYYHDSDDFVGFYWDQISARLRNSKRFYLQLLKKCSSAIEKKQVRGLISRNLLSNLIQLAPQSIAADPQVQAFLK